MDKKGEERQLKNMRVLGNIQISEWSHILGPRTLVNYNGVLDKEGSNPKLIALITLSGEDESDYKLYNHQCSIKHYMIKGYCLLAISFMNPNSDTHMSLAVINTDTVKDKYVIMLPALKACFLHYYLQFKGILLKDPRMGTKAMVQSKAIAKVVHKVAFHVDRILSGCRPHITAFTYHHNLFSYDQHQPDDHIQFLVRCLSSHLETQCRTIVIGNDLKVINKMLYTLITCCNTLDRHRVLYADGTAAYNPFVRVQGFPASIHEFMGTTLLRADGPSTIIDLTNWNILRTVNGQRFEALKAGYVEYLVDVKAAPVNVNAYGPFLIKPRRAPMVETMVKSAFTLPKSLRSAFAIQMYRLFSRQAALFVYNVLATCVDKSSVDGDSIQAMRDQLHLKDEKDYEVILAMAERLHPGILHMCTYEVARIESQLLAIFDTY